MGAFGIGILIVSISLLAYKVPIHTWWQHLGVRQPTKPTIPQIKGITPQKKEQEDGKRLVDRPPSLPVIEEASGESNASTPRARPETDLDHVIPSFSLEDTQQLENEKKERDNSREINRRSSTRDPISEPLPSPSRTKKSGPTPSPQRPSSNNLMPPPAVKASALRPLPKLNGSLNPPPSAASTLRGPPRGTQNLSSSNLAPTTSTQPPSARPSKKVVLDPGHSPLDWANLTKNPQNSSFLRGASVPPYLIKVTPSQLRYQNGRKGRDAWGTYQGKVYNLTPYLKFHPGGVGELMRGAGKVGDAERLFLEIHPWVNWDGLLGECLVGILVSEGDLKGETDLEVMD
jgi:cytochrome b involved in lipid metabolism